MKKPSPNDDTTLDALFDAARAERPDTSRAEFGFETRLLARLNAERAGSAGWQEFAVWCWRLAPGLAVVTVAFTVWAVHPSVTPVADDPLFAASSQPPMADEDDLAQWIAVQFLPPI